MTGKTAAASIGWQPTAVEQRPTAVEPMTVPTVAAAAAKQAKDGVDPEAESQPEAEPKATAKSPGKIKTPPRSKAQFLLPLSFLPLGGAVQHHACPFCIWAYIMPGCPFWRTFDPSTLYAPPSQTSEEREDCDGVPA